MIEDKFTLTQQIGNSTVRTLCKDCKCEFNVELDILRPKNCNYDLGKAVTIVCPQCTAAATTTEKESRIRVLTTATDAMRGRIQTYLKNNRVRFKVLRSDVDGDPAVAHMECQMCGYEFPINLRIGENIQPTVRQSFIITCPLCSEQDETSKRNAFDKAAMAVEIAKYEQLMSMLNDLKGDSGGQKAVQTPV